MGHEEIHIAYQGGPFCITEDGWALDRCNDCGILIPYTDQLCGPCYKLEWEANEWEAMHPGWRCPPRE